MSPTYRRELALSNGASSRAVYPGKTPKNTLKKTNFFATSAVRERERERESEREREREKEIFLGRHHANGKLNFLNGRSQQF